MADRFCVTRRVEFSETDMAGIVHFAQFFRYMEAAEHAFFRSLGLSVHATVDGVTIGWPRVSASCDYKAPLRFEDEFEVRVLVKAKGDKTLTCVHVFSKLADGGPVEVARGELTLICAELNETDKTMRAIAIPETIDRLIEPAPAEAFE